MFRNKKISFKFCFFISYCKACNICLGNKVIVLIFFFFVMFPINFKQGVIFYYDTNKSSKMDIDFFFQFIDFSS